MQHAAQPCHDKFSSRAANLLHHAASDVSQFVSVMLAALWLVVAAAGGAAAPAARLAAATCAGVEATLCGNATKPTECLLCLGLHEAPLDAANCTQADYHVFCKSGPPPGPPGPPPPPTCASTETTLCGSVNKKTDCFLCIGAHEVALKAVKCTQTDYTTFCAPGSGPGPPPPPSSCASAEAALCGNETKPTKCLLCVGAHEAPLKTARCAPADLQTFCTAGPPPPPSPPGPGPASPANATGCLLRAGQPAVYQPLCQARLNLQDCVDPLHEHACYWNSPPEPTPSGCTTQMKLVCGSAPTVNDCQVCMVAHHTSLMSYPQTGTYYNCAATDFTAFCAAITPSSRNATGCLLRAGQPAVYDVLCASRDSETACEQALYEHTCMWSAPRDGTPPACKGAMEKLCGGSKQSTAKCETCCVANAKSLLTRPQTGTYVDCAISDFTSFCSDN